MDWLLILGVFLLLKIVITSIFFISPLSILSKYIVIVYLVEEWGTSEGDYSKREVLYLGKAYTVISAVYLGLWEYSRECRNRWSEPTAEKLFDILAGKTTTKESLHFTIVPGILSEKYNRTSFLQEFLHGTLPATLISPLEKEDNLVRFILNEYFQDCDKKGFCYKTVSFMTNRIFG